MYGGGGAQPRSVDVRAAVPDARRVEAGDFLLDETGAVRLLLLAALPLGRDARLLCTFPERGEPRCSPLERARCRLLGQDEPGSLWCFGEGPARMLLHRLEGPPHGPRFWLPGDTLPAAALQTGAHASLLAPARGRLWLILPHAGLLVETGLDNGSVEWRRLPGFPLPDGAPSFAACGGRLAALLPLERGGGAERLDAPYGLFALDSGWRRVAGERHWLRGARLAGGEPGAAWIWDRSRQRLERVPVPAR